MTPFFSKTVSFAKYKNWHSSKDFILEILKETYSFQLREFNSQINFFFTTAFNLTMGTILGIGLRYWPDGLFCPTKILFYMQH